MAISNQEKNQQSVAFNTSSIVATGGFKNLTGTGAHTS